MKKKRLLSLLLALIMMVSLLPLNVFAAEVGSDAMEDVTPVEETIPADETAPADEAAPAEKTADAPAEEPAPADEPTPVKDEAEQPLAAAMPAALSDDAAVAAVTTKPADGTSVGQPFPTSVIGNGHYRIPAFVTLSDGTLVAAADARWRTWNSSCDDAGDIDTIVSYSKDNGTNWNYTFANYIENGRSSSNNYAAATFIDPALATDGKTVYMLVDLYPGQGSASQCSSASQSGSGYDTNGYLKLSTTNQASANSTFAYYLKDGQIYDYSTNTDQGYTVDAHFNVTKDDGTDCGNLFNYNNTCGFHPLMTSYLYLTTSTDGGATWSVPQMLNPQLKTDSSDTYFLVSPGRGLVTSDGTLIFGAYGAKGACLIYSRDNGKTWNRSASCTSTWTNASENEIVELSDGTLRMFIRHTSGDKLQYVDATKSESGTYTWGDIQTLNITVQDNVNVTAISYSEKTTDGKKVILVAVATSTGGTYDRKNGKIFTFTVDASNNMTLAKTFEVNGTNEAYSYSCLTEQSDGSIGLLYEKGDSGNITYANYDVTTVTGPTFASEPVATVTDTTTGITAKAEGLTSITVEPKEAVTGDKEVSKTYAITLNGGEYKDAATLTIPVDAAFESCTGFYGKVGSNRFDVTKDADGENFVCNVPHFSDVTIYGTLAETGKADKTQDITLDVKGKSEPVTVDGEYEGPYTTADPSIATVSTEVNTTVETPASTTAVSMSSDDTYEGIIGNDDQWIKLNGTTIGYTTNPADATEFKVTRTTSSGLFSTTTTYTIRAGSYYLNGSTSGVTASSGSSNWYFNNNGFAYRTSSYRNTYYYLTFSNNNWTVSESNTSTKSTLYTYPPAVEGSSTTAITFTGVAPGTTSVVVGDTKFNITVNPVEKTANVNLTTGSSTTLDALNVLGWTDETNEYTVTYALTAGNCVTLTNATVTGNTDGTATVTGTVKKGDVTYATVTYTITVADYTVPTVANTPFIGGDTTYHTKYSNNNKETSAYLNYQGKGKEITGLVITAGSDYDLDISSKFTGEVTWGTTNSDYITVDADGVVTAKKPTDDDVPVYVTATIGGQTYAIPVRILESTKTESTTWDNTRVLDYYNNLEYNCTAYYSYRLESLRELPQGTQIFIEHDRTATDDLINFFATPDEGYALTYVNGTGGEYFHTIRDETGKDFGSNFGGGNGNCNDTMTQSAVSTNGNVWLHDQLIGYTNNKIYLGLSNEEYLKKLHAMLMDAVEKGCDGAFLWSRMEDASGIYSCSIFSTLTFIAEKLPEMSKELTGVTTNGVYQPYTEGMTVGVNDTLHYTIYVNVPTMVYETESVKIDYNSFKVDDTLTTAKWTANSLSSETAETSFTYKNGSEKNVDTTYSNDKTLATYINYIKSSKPDDGSVHLLKVDSFVYDKADGTRGTYSASESNVYAFHTDLTLTQENFATVVKNGTITNQANLEYTYKANYSKGTGTTKSFTVIVNIMVKAPSYVIDFGLPVSINLNEIAYGVTFTIVDNPKYGAAAISGSTLTYTPKTILPESDFITLSYTSGSKTLGTGVRIYPATSVFYEESFLTYSDGWTSSSTAPASQATEVLGKHSHNYGYDPVYSNLGTTGSYKMSTTVGDTATFTFTGTGFQLYANSDANSGIVTVRREDDGPSLNKLYVIDTVLSTGDTVATNQQKSDTYYSLPIISETNLDCGTYKVTIKHTNSEKPIYIDGVRVLGTMSDSTIYKADLEDNPNFYELRDYVLKAIGVESVASDYGTVKDMAGQVYNGNNIGENSAIVIDTNASNYPTDNAGYAQDLLDNGPKNELYLYGGQTLVFKVTTNRVMQLGLKAPTGSADYKLTVDGTEQTKTLSTCVDMFYEIASKANTATEHMVTITVPENSGVLSVTLLKICDDPSAAFATLTQDDIEGALLGIYGISKEETTEPTDPVAPTDPVQPDEPDEPTVPDEPDDEPDTLTTTLTVNYVNLFGRKVGTATLTKEMTDGSWRISAREINANAPAGRRALCLFPVTVNAGQQKTIVIPVL